MFRIDPFQPADLPAIAGFAAAIQEHERAMCPELKSGAEIAASHAALLVETITRRDGVILLAKDAGQTIGFVCVWVDGNDDPLLRDDARAHAYISDIYVVEGWRRRGVAHALLQAAEAAMRERGCRRIRIGSKASNLAALSCYESAGYRAYETTFTKLIE